MNIDNRLDLDNYITEVINNFPKSNEDFIFYIRGNMVDGDLCFLSSSTYDNFGNVLYSLAKNNELILEQIQLTMQEIIKDKN
jgi:hypothetical protein